MLVPEMIVITLVSYRESSNMLSSFYKWAILRFLILWSIVLTEKWLEKVFTKWKPSISSLCKELEEGKILLRWLFASTMELLILSLCLEGSLSKEKQYRFELFEW